MKGIDHSFSDAQYFGNTLSHFDDRSRPQEIGERIVNSLSRPIYIGDEQVQIGASIGGAFYPDDGENSEELIKAADNAMYIVKKKEKGAITFA